MMSHPFLFALVAALLLVCCSAADPATITHIEASFELASINVALESGVDSDESAVATPYFRKEGASAWTEGHGLTRVAVSNFAGSLLLQAGTDYEVKVVFDGGDSGLDGSSTSVEMFSTRSESSLSSTGTTTLFVSPTGSSSSSVPCTSRNSPCSVSRAVGMVAPGTDVVFLDGTYFSGAYAISSKVGSAASQIVFRADNDGGVIFDGSQENAPSWTKTNDDWTTQLSVDTHLVAVGGTRLFPYPSLDDGTYNLHDLSVGYGPNQEEAEESGLAGWYQDGTTLHVKMDAANSNPGSNVRVAIHPYAFQVTNSEYVRFEGIDFQHYGTGSFGKTIYFDTTSFGSVKSCSFTNTECAVCMKRRCDGLVVQDSSFVDSKDLWQWDAVKAEGKSEGGAIGLFTSGALDITNFVLRRNTFTGYFDSVNIGASEFSDGYSAAPNNMDVSDNSFKKSSDDAISADGRCMGCVIRNNEMRDVLVAISWAPTYNGPTYALYNTIYGQGYGYSKNGYTGMSFKMNVGYCCGGSHYFYHNTVSSKLSASDKQSSNAAAVLNTGNTWDALVGRNNIYMANDHALFVTAVGSGHPQTHDYDILDSVDSIANVDGIRYDTTAALFGATGHEEHGLAVTPLFVNEGVHDYRPKSASAPQVDAAVLIPNFNDDFSGAAPDIGSEEYDDQDVDTCDSKPGKPKSLSAYHDGDGLHIEYTRDASSQCEKIKIREEGTKKWKKIKSCHSGGLPYSKGKQGLKKKLGGQWPGDDYKTARFEVQVKSMDKSLKGSCGTLKSKSAKAPSQYTSK
eukprot:TRINITY_DN17090_c0_g1_i1.p1 TRINITY_DN17090_c0_g1~~TRINITY_DN17090_c0_g1_i1.p1  ORF type:complete len:792 (-),score=191.99 TRINITY_DN17090_c0_g1_i1:171-2546(-)